MKKSFVLNATAAQGRPVSASRKGLSRMARRILGAKSIIRSPATPPHPASFLPFRWLVENFFFQKTLESGTYYFGGQNRTDGSPFDGAGRPKVDGTKYAGSDDKDEVAWYDGNKITRRCRQAVRSKACGTAPPSRAAGPISGLPLLFSPVAPPHSLQRFPSAGRVFRCFQYVVRYLFGNQFCVVDFTLLISVCLTFPRGNLRSRPYFSVIKRIFAW